MCGIVALAGPVPPQIAAAAVAGARARGPHQHGWATRSADGWQLTAGHGPLPDPQPSSALQIGHSRLATSGSSPGDHPPLHEAQPYTAGALLIAHNGVLDDVPPGQVDSRQLLEQLAAEGPHAALALLAAAAHPGAALIHDGTTLYAIRSDGPSAPAHPLHVASTGAWTALSSAPLPKGRLIPTDTLTEVHS